MSVTYPTKLVLAFRSGDRCAFPGCNRALTVDGGPQSEPAVIGQAAHIAGEKPGAARYDENMSDLQRNHCDNLIYLCCDHHTQIDKQEDDFSVADLLATKAEHERRLREATNDAFAEVGFPELEHATQWIHHINALDLDYNFTVIPLADKIKKNELSEKVTGTIKMGLAAMPDVKDFVISEAKNDSEFPERLKAGFLEEYYRLRKKGVRGDELFDLMCQFAQRGFKEQSQRSAGLAILIYFFESCEVFEK